MDLPDFLVDRDGEIDVRGHRIGLYNILSFYREGESAEWLAERYPTLTPAEIRSVIAFYEANRCEVDAYLETYREDLDRQRAEAPSPKLTIEELRRRALARQGRGRLA